MTFSRWHSHGKTVSLRPFFPAIGIPRPYSSRTCCRRAAALQDGVVGTLGAHTDGNCCGPLCPRRGAAELFQLLQEREATG